MAAAGCTPDRAIRGSRSREKPMPKPPRGLAQKSRLLRHPNGSVGTRRYGECIDGAQKCIECRHNFLNPAACRQAAGQAQSC
jgi:hypothetical protein